MCWYWIMNYLFRHVSANNQEHKLQKIFKTDAENAKRPIYCLSIESHLELHLRMTLTLKWPWHSLFPRPLWDKSKLNRCPCSKIIVPPVYDVVCWHTKQLGFAKSNWAAYQHGYPLGVRHQQVIFVIPKKKSKISISKGWLHLGL